MRLTANQPVNGGGGGEIIFLRHPIIISFFLFFKLLALTGLYAETTSGIVASHITYDGKSFKGFNPGQMALLIGYVPQIIIPAFDYSVIDYVVTGCAPQIGTFSRPKQKHYDIAMRSIRDLGIEHLSEKSYKQISGGERQQASIARVLAQSPSYILMDEPTSNLDYGNQVRVLNTIKRLAHDGFGVVFTTHNPDHALLIGGKTAILNRQGVLVSGDSSELVNETILSELYGVSLHVTNLDETGRKVCFAPGLN